MNQTFAVTIEPTLESVPVVRHFVEDACARVNADRDVALALELAVDEAVTNIVLHAQPPSAPIEVGLRAEHERLTATIHDHTAPFNPADAPPPDLTSELMARRAGGLGWFFVFKKMDEVHYQSDPATGNVLTLVKRLPIRTEARTT